MGTEDSPDRELLTLLRNPHQIREVAFYPGGTPVSHPGGTPSDTRSEPLSATVSDSGKYGS